MAVSRKELRKAADNIVSRSLMMRRGERLLLIGNPGTKRITTAFKDAAAAAGAKVELVEQGKKHSLQPAEPQLLEAIQRAIEDPHDVVYAALEHKLGFDPNAKKKPLVHEGVPHTHSFTYLLERYPKNRIYFSPSITEEIFAKLAGVDFAKLHQRTVKLKGILGKAVAIEIETVGPKGEKHKLVVPINEKKYPSYTDSGWAGEGVEKPQGNLPAGEWFTTPDGGKGSIVIDGSISHLSDANVVKEPFILRVRNGFVTKIDGKGKDAKKVADSLKRSADKALKDFKGKKGERLARGTYLLGEVAIGLNEEINEPIGNMLSDEKIGATTHVAIGKGFHGKTQEILTHFDQISLRPRITAVFKKGGKIRRRLLVENGEMKV